MKRFWGTLLRRNGKTAPGEFPRTMLDLRGSDPCWCGKDKPYRKCHRPEDRKREKELGLDRRKGTLCEAFT